MVPRVFDKYEIIRRIAVGGMGEIFLARQVGVARFERLAILKSLLPELALDEKAVDMFLDEARVAATLNHPNIVAIYEVGMWQGMYFIAMEYISGDSIARLLLEASRRKMWIPSQVTARVIMDTATGLDHAHRATDLEGRPLRIVHRDISPQNIMVREDGVTKVVDFGIARAANRITRTKTGMLRGKAGYFPPEVLKDAKPDHLSDQYSLGVVLWEMCVGQRLFQPSDNHLKQLQRIADGDIRPPQSIRKSLDKGLTEITMRMLANDPAKRYRGCSEVAEELKGYLESSAGSRGVTDTTAVSGLVQNLVGAELEARIADLTPSGATELESLLGHRDTPAHSTPSGFFDASASGAAEGAASSWFAHRGRLIAALLVILSIGIIAAAVAVKTFVMISSETATPAVPPANTAALSILEPAGAVVWVDGERWPGVTPTSVTGLTPGSHDIRLTRPDRPTIRKQVDLHSGRQILELSAADLQPVVATATAPPPKADTGKKKRPSPRPPSKKKPTPADARPAPGTGDGFLTINSQPWTEVYVDGKPLGVTPKWKIALTPGAHTLRLVNREAGLDVTRKIQVKSGAAIKLKYPW